MESAEQEERPVATLAEQTNTVPLSNGGEPEAVVGTEQAVRTIPSLESIRRKLSVAGLTDEAKQFTAVPPTIPLTTKPNPSHRRSRSLGDIIFAAPTTTTPPPRKGKVLARSQKLLLGANLTESKGTSQGLEQIKQSLLQEIKNKLKEQIELKKSGCHSDADKEVVVATGPVIDQQSVELIDNKEATPPQPDDSGDGHGTKRFSICSLSGVELRKRYSPVYERTRKIVRQSSGSINRLSSSQPRVVVTQQKAIVTGPNSPSASLDTEGTAAVLSPVTSKGDLEEAEEGDTTCPVIDSKELIIADSPKGDKSNGMQENVMTTSSSTRIGQYSAHPSVYIIEQEDRSRLGDSTRIDESRSDKMDKSTSTLKRGASFKGLRKNIKKTFSTQIPVLTLEKADKAPDTNVPAIVVCCVETLRRKGFLKTEGLYRSSPSQLEVRKVIKHARKGQYDYVKAVDDPVLLAGTLKSFFFSLKHHIVSQEVMEKNFPKKCLSSSLSEDEYVERLHGLISDLETIQYESLEYIIKHLQEVASYSKNNLMTPSNLGVVWAPCIFTNCDNANGADLLSFMGEQTRLLELMITNADMLFDRYTLDEIMIAIEDGYPGDSSRDGEPTLNLRPDFDSMLGGADFERRKLLRNLSLTFDNVFEAACNENGHSVRRHYDLQNSSTVPDMKSAHSDGTVTNKQRLQKMKRSKSRAACVVS